MERVSIPLWHFQQLLQRNILCTRTQQQWGGEAGRERAACCSPAAEAAGPGRGSAEGDVQGGSRSEPAGPASKQAGNRIEQHLGDQDASSCTVLSPSELKIPT